MTLPSHGAPEAVDQPGGGGSISIRTVLVWLLKGAISGGLIWFALSKVDAADLQSRLARISICNLALAVGLVVLQVGLLSLRWRWVASALGRNLSFARALHVLSISMFLNQLLPATLGGDVYRTMILAKQGCGIVAATSVVLCDRLIALVALLAMMACLTPVVAMRIDDWVFLRGWCVLVVTGSAACILFALSPALFGKLSKSRIMESVARPMLDLRVLLFSTRIAPSLLLLSCVVHLVSVSLMALLAGAMGIPTSLIDALIVVPVTLLTTMLPISLAGWGVREATAVFCFGLLGVSAPDALTISVSFGAVYMIVGLLGALVWLIWRTPE